MHGGTNPGAPRGPENGNYKHGLYSDYVGEDDQEALELVRYIDDLEILDFLTRYETMRFLRAAEILPDAELTQLYVCGSCGEDLASSEQDSCGVCGASFDDVEPVLADREVDLYDGAHANRAEQIARMMDTKSKIEKRVHSILEGETLHLDAETEHSLDEESRDALLDRARDLLDANDHDLDDCGDSPPRVSDDSRLGESGDEGDA